MKKNKKPTNPKAFPSLETDRNGNYFAEGMTLRDYFAAKEKCVLTNAYWACDIFQTAIIEQAKKENKSVQELMSEMAYSESDAMLKQREL